MIYTLDRIEETLDQLIYQQELLCNIEHNADLSVEYTQLEKSQESLKAHFFSLLPAYKFTGRESQKRAILLKIDAFHALSKAKSLSKEPFQTYLHLRKNRLASKARG